MNQLKPQPYPIDPSDPCPECAAKDAEIARLNQLCSDHFSESAQLMEDTITMHAEIDRLRGLVRGLRIDLLSYRSVCGNLKHGTTRNTWDAETERLIRGEK